MCLDKNTFTPYLSNEDVSSEGGNDMPCAHVAVGRWAMSISPSKTDLYLPKTDWISLSEIMNMNSLTSLTEEHNGYEFISTEQEGAYSNVPATWPRFTVWARTVTWGWELLKRWEPGSQSWMISGVVKTKLVKHCWWWMAQDIFSNSSPNIDSGRSQLSLFWRHAWHQ